MLTDRQREGETFENLKLLSELKIDYYFQAHVKKLCIDDLSKVQEAMKLAFFVNIAFIRDLSVVDSTDNRG